jgi:uncharacterized protein YjiS (DUF1127 family)
MSRRLHALELESYAHKQRSAAIAKFLAEAVAGLFAPIKAYIARQRTIAELESLDNRMLDDIGLTRGDIHAVAYGSLSRMPHADAQVIGFPARHAPAEEGARKAA